MTLHLFASSNPYDNILKLENLSARCKQGWVLEEEKRKGLTKEDQREKGRQKQNMETERGKREKDWALYEINSQRLKKDESEDKREKDSNEMNAQR